MKEIGQSGTLPEGREADSCRLCQGRGYYLERFADNFFTPCRCRSAVAGAGRASA
jgi:hypothetical protein